MSDKTYTCEMCGETFALQDSDDWNDEKAKAEFMQAFPKEDMANQELAVVCSLCYGKIMAVRSFEGV